MKKNEDIEMDFVFILGIARTGSKIYQNILNTESEINIMMELHFLAPRLIRKDFRFTVEKKIRDLKVDSNIPKLIDLMYSNTLEGTFFKIPNESFDPKKRIVGLDKEKLKERILESDISYKSIFKILLEEHSWLNEKKIGGGKFPVDISYLPTLLEWFPDSKIIHIIRDPRAVYSSMTLGEIKKISSCNRFKKYIISIKRFFYLWYQYKQAVKIHKKYRDFDNYYLSRFEDIVTQPENYIKQLCDFLDIDFKKGMLYPPVVNSSYEKSNKNLGLDTKTISRWKDYLSPNVERAITGT